MAVADLEHHVTAHGDHAQETGHTESEYSPHSAIGATMDGHPRRILQDLPAPPRIPFLLWTL